MSGNEPTRRALLKNATKVGIGSVAALTVAGGVASAESDIDRGEMMESYREMKQLERAYRDGESLRSAIERDGGIVLDALVEEGYLEEASLSSLLGSEVSEASTVSELDGVTVSSLAYEGTKTAFLKVETEVNGEAVEVFVLPEAGRTYAFVNEDDGGLLRVDPQNETIRMSHDCDLNSDCGAECKTTDEDNCPRGGERIYHNSVIYRCCTLCVPISVSCPDSINHPCVYETC